MVKLGTVSYRQIAVNQGIGMAFWSMYYDARMNRSLRRAGLLKKKDDVKVEDVEVKEVAEETIINEMDIDDGRETNLVVVPSKEDPEVSVIKDKNEPTVLNDDQLASMIEDAYKAIKADGKQIKLCLSTIAYLADAIDLTQLVNSCGKTESGAMSTESMEFINSMVKFYSNVLLFPTISAYSINETVSIDLLKEVVNFFRNYEDIQQEYYAIDVIVEKTRDLLIEASRNSMKSEGAENPDPIVPIMFVNKNLDLMKSQGVSKTVLAKLDKELGDILSMYQYQINKLNDMIEIVIYDDKRMDSYLVDPGTIIGNGYNVVSYVPGDTIMVNQKHKDILAKVFANKNYVLSPEEIQKVCQDMFTNLSIYSMIDMSKGAEIFPKLSEEEFVKLGKKLSFIMNLDWGVTTVPASRLRFRTFKSIDDFVLVSDAKCKCQIPGEMIDYITTGLSVKVNGDDITVKVNEDYTKQYKIEDYNLC